jgi:hypothetical protein
MPWTAANKDSILNHAGLAVTEFNVSLVNSRTARVEQYGGELAVTRIQGQLAKLDTIDESLTANAEDGAIEVLGIGEGIKYFAGGTRAAVLAEKDRLIGEILTALELEGFRNSSSSMNGWATSRIVRS